MKPALRLILSAMLTIAILAPSVITLANTDEKVIVIDLSEEEKKETNEKDFFLDGNFSFYTLQQKERVSISYLYIESNYNASLAILLPPPQKHS